MSSVLESLFLNDFHCTVKAEGISGEPDLPAAAAPDGANQFVIWHQGNCRLLRHALIHPVPLLFEQPDFLLQQREDPVFGEINVGDIDF